MLWDPRQNPATVPPVPLPVLFPMRSALSQRDGRLLCRLPRGRSRRFASPERPLPGGGDRGVSAPWIPSEIFRNLSGCVSSAGAFAVSPTHGNPARSARPAHARTHLIASVHRRAAREVSRRHGARQGPDEGKAPRLAMTRRHRVMCCVEAHRTGRGTSGSPDGEGAPRPRHLPGCPRDGARAAHLGRIDVFAQPERTSRSSWQLRP